MEWTWNGKMRNGKELKNDVVQLKCISLDRSTRANDIGVNSCQKVAGKTLDK